EGLVNYALGIETIMARPLIIGTSLSADSVSISPGRQLARRFTDDEHIDIHAAGGQTGFSILSKLRAAQLQGRSVVIGLDLFFWDSLLDDAAGSLKTLEMLINKTGKLKLSLILGDIPELLPGFQPSRLLLNQDLRALTRSSPHCKILSLDKLHQALILNKKLKTKGKYYSPRELLPDGLHLSPPASEFLADSLQELIHAEF
ncbi:MAG: hypothetical protein NTX25_19835, partial [Proteobacteria bacterium]|nr:hypothetical protein [Pseudomonadota bacterium]